MLSPSITGDPSSPAAPRGPLVSAARKVDSATILGRRILLLYAVVYYVMPAILTALFGAAIDQILITSPNYITGTAFIALALITIFYFLGKIRRPRLIFFRPLSLMLFNPAVIFLASLTFLALGVYFWLYLGLSFRQSGDRISETGGIVIVFYLFQSYVMTALVILVGLSAEALRRHAFLLGPAIVCIITGLFLSIQAASNILMLSAAVIVLARLVSCREFLRPTDRRPSVAVLAILGIAGLGAIFVGLANKYGVDETVNLVMFNFDQVVGIVQRRISYHYYTASYHTTFNFLNFELGWRAASDVLTNMEHRIDVLLGNPTTFNEITSVKRLNFEMIAYYMRDRAGAAPGLVGGIFFYPFGVFLLPLIALFYASILKMISLSVSMRPGLVEQVFLVLFFGGIVDGALDMFNIFDLGFVRLLLLAIACAQFAPGAKSAFGSGAVAHQPAHPLGPARRWS